MFKVGDVVVLRSDGHPRITVNELEVFEDHTICVVCKWFDAVGHLHEGRFSPDALEVVRMDEAKCADALSSAL